MHGPIYKQCFHGCFQCFATYHPTPNRMYGIGTIAIYLYSIERLHIHSNENKHKNNHGYGVKSAILLYQFQCACCDKYMIKV